MSFVQATTSTVAPTRAPSTPKSTTPVASQSPGKWRHPRLQEIVKRQNAATFSDTNMRKALCNGGAFVLVSILKGPIKGYSYRSGLVEHGSRAPDIFITALCILFVINIVVALLPLFRPKDNLADIPLTPTQRALLGLDPSSTPPVTPGTQYITPPKYRLSSPARTASPGSRNASPNSANGGSTGYRTSYSPTNSPLFHKAMSNGSREGGRRQSFSSSSMVSPLRDSVISRLPTSPSTSGSKASNLGLNNKWLYEKGRGTSGNGFL